MITPVLTNELSLLDLAQQGDSESQYQLALQYHHGMALEKDHAKDHAEAEKRYRLVSSKKDHTEAVKWYREAANRGSWLALYGISRLYLETDSPQASDVKAYVWINILQDLILRIRQQKIKLTFKKPVISEKDGKLVFENEYNGLVWANKNIKMLSKRMPETELAESQFQLASAIYSGKGGAKQDTKEASRWYKRSAKLGNAKAQTNLGLMYYYGDGIAQNRIQAYLWWFMAAGQGEKQALDNLQSLSQSLTQDELTQGQALATKCWESKFQDCD